MHGFAVDENFRKMSKSVGNVVLPEDIIKGKDGKPPLGIDVLRYIEFKTVMIHSIDAINGRDYVSGGG